MRKRERGYAGERAAERLLRRSGLIILARNWRAAGGELDLTALEDETLVFVEVKTRAAGFSDRYPSVSGNQKRRIARAARAFRGRFGVRRLPFRFDLMLVTGDPRLPDEITWLRNYQRTHDDQP